MRFKIIATDQCSIDYIYNTAIGFASKQYTKVSGVTVNGIVYHGWVSFEDENDAKEVSHVTGLPMTQN